MLRGPPGSPARSRMRSQIPFSIPVLGYFGQGPRMCRPGLPMPSCGAILAAARALRNRGVLPGCGWRLQLLDAKGHRNAAFFAKAGDRVTFTHVNVKSR